MMDIKPMIEKYFPGALRSVIFLVIAVILYRVIAFLLQKSTGSGVGKRVKKAADKSYITLLGRVIKAVYLLVVVLMLLQLNGINVSAMLAGVGIAGTVIGLAAQDVLKDIIRGFSIIAENYYKVGDVVKIGDYFGPVLYRGIKTTKLSDMKTGNTVILANRNIEQVEVVSGCIYLDVPLPYDLPLSKEEQAMERVSRAVSGLSLVRRAEYKKVSELGESAILYRLAVLADPKEWYQAKRDALRETLSVLEKEGIHIPYNQIDVHLNPQA